MTDDAGRILLVRRNREPGKNQWALPGGFIEMHESPAAAAARELEEECGISARDPSLVDIIYQESGFYGTSLLIICYSFAAFGGTPRAGDDAEKVRFFAVDRLPKLAFEAHERLIKKYLEKRDELRRLWSEEV